MRQQRARHYFAIRKERTRERAHRFWLTASRSILAVFGGRAVQALEGTAHTTFDVIEGRTPGETYTISVAAMTAGGDGPPIDVKVTVPK